MRHGEKPNWWWPQGVHRDISRSPSGNRIKISPRNTHPPPVSRTIPNNSSAFIANSYPDVHSRSIRQPHLTLVKHIDHSSTICHFEYDAGIVLSSRLCRDARYSRIPETERFIWH